MIIAGIFPWLLIISDILRIQPTASDFYFNTNSKFLMFYGQHYAKLADILHIFHGYILKDTELSISNALSQCLTHISSSFIDGIRCHIVSFWLADL